MDEPESPALGSISHHIRFVLDPNRVSLFSPLFQRGVYVLSLSGSTLKKFLCDQLGILPEYLGERITTLFLDGKPVDDPASVTITADATVSLSASMPGLAGAALRKRGTYSVLRQGISSPRTPAAASPAPCLVRVKLFNLIIDEAGAGLLTRGVWVQSAELAGFLEERSADLGSSFRVLLDGSSADLPSAARVLWADGTGLTHLKADIEG